MPKVAVVIPCYNDGRYIDDAVDSILHQTYKDLDIIIVNDGSDDKYTARLLSDFIRPKTRVIHVNYRNPGAARNHGIRETDSKYILTLDADDKFEQTFLEKAVRVLDGNRNVGVVTCWVKLFGNWIGQWKPMGGNVRDFLLENNACGSSLFRRVCWEQVCGYDETPEQGYEDWDFWIKITERGWEVYSIPEYLYFYRKTLKSTYLNARKRHPELVRNIVRNHRQIYEKYIDHIIYEKEKIINDLYKSVPYRIGTVIIAIPVIFFIPYFLFRHITGSMKYWIKRMTSGK
jgi:glycosyltransferase involved in cell wall biosynthesis